MLIRGAPAGSEKGCNREIYPYRGSLNLTSLQAAEAISSFTEIERPQTQPNSASSTRVTTPAATTVSVSGCSSSNLLSAQQPPSLSRQQAGPGETRSSTSASEPANER